MLATELPRKNKKKRSSQFTTTFKEMVDATPFVKIMA